MFKNLFGSKKEEPTPNEIQDLEESLIESTQLDQEVDLYEESEITTQDGWSSTQEQELLFSAMLLFYSPEMSILDAGCGRADLFGYLSRTFQTNIPYKGIDFNPNLLEVSRLKYPAVSVSQSDILDMTENADWVVASGLFNIASNPPGIDMAEYTQRCIDKMYESANIGVAFNLLTGYPDDIADEDKAVLVPHNPSVWLDYLLSKYTKVICRTDYMLGDVTFFILK